LHLECVPGESSTFGLNLDISSTRNGLARVRGIKGRTWSILDFSTRLEIEWSTQGRSKDYTRPRHSAEDRVVHMRKKGSCSA